MQNLNVKMHHIFDALNKDEKLILLGGASLYLHYSLTILVLIGILIYIAKEGRILQIIQGVPRAKLVLLFCVITTIVALLYKNWLGAVCGVGMLFLFLYVFYYRSVITKRTFEIMLDICCMMSLLCVVWGLIEYAFICHRLGENVFALCIANSPKNRIHVGFFNANYYSMMIEFTVLIALYKAMQWKSYRHTIFYAVCVVANFFALYLTGTRTAWIPFIISIPVLILCCRMYKLFTVSLVGLAGVVGVVAMNPDLLKRSVSIGTDLAKRENIWATAIKGIQAHPLFGEGPLTYYKIYPLYHGHPTQHAHSIYLDPILSFGVLPVLIVALYFASNCKEIYYLLKKKVDIALFGLIVAFVITILIHGILDYTVYWIQTGALFLLVFGSSSIYFRKGSIDV